MDPLTLRAFNNAQQADAEILIPYSSGRIEPSSSVLSPTTPAHLLPKRLSALDLLGSNGSFHFITSSSPLKVEIQPHQSAFPKTPSVLLDDRASPIFGLPTSSEEIWVFRDEGTCISSCYALAREVESLWPHLRIRFVDAEEIIEGLEAPRVFMFIMGGGVCSDWEKRLGVKGMIKIHTYMTEQGGRFLGICAAAYFAARKSTFSTPSYCIEKTRPVDLFNVHAVGPIGGTSDDTVLSIDSARAMEVVTPYRQKGKIYTQGGPELRALSDDEPISIIASYLSGHHAIIGKEFPKGGYAIISSGHIEFSWSNTSPSPHEGYMTLAEALNQVEVFRVKILWKRIQELFTPKKPTPTQ